MAKTTKKLSKIARGLATPKIIGRIPLESYSKGGMDYNQGTGDYTQTTGGDHEQGGGGYNQSFPGIKTDK